MVWAGLVAAIVLSLAWLILFVVETSPEDYRDALDAVCKREENHA